ncbi:3-isopropylmalate dehydratase [Anaerosporomusa subterranea]|uniref:3-isopropylmalate dehydratase small subunit n=1 Tax=Anaerosporomusa subterranea TaxID=1794912 RepID=A0A154BM08_ANASB|nr:3-isopropylmalate dehydratase small subunit [Anaerosporomusa subterranea]KYZ75017.1 3-isopropylmalate dehydratase [Anaerosporomusa subterranea]
MHTLRGNVLKYGDNINTDLISPPQYLEKSMEVIAQHAMEGIDEQFASKVQPGDILVAGDNFGPGSSRETAPIALKMAGVGAIVAKFFARIFYRNAINIGLPVLECPDIDKIQDGDALEIDLESGIITNITKGEQYKTAPLSEPVMDVLSAGGLIPFLEKQYGTIKS